MNFGAWDSKDPQTGRHIFFITNVILKAFTLQSIRWWSSKMDIYQQEPEDDLGAVQENLDADIYDIDGKYD